MGKEGFLPKKRYCEKCGEEHYAEKHHICPKKHCGKTLWYISLCHDCHVNIHWLIDNFGKLFKYQYEAITKRWLKGKVKNHDDVQTVLDKLKEERQAAKK